MAGKVALTLHLCKIADVILKLYISTECTVQPNQSVYYKGCNLKRKVQYAVCLGKYYALAKCGCFLCTDVCSKL